MISATTAFQLACQEDWPDGILVIDQEGQIVEVTPVAERLLGVSKPQLLNCSIHHAVCARSRDVAHNLAQCPLMHSVDDQYTMHSAYWVTGDGQNIGVDYRVFELETLRSGTKVVSFHENIQKKYNQAELYHFAQYVECSPTPMAEFDLEAQMVFANPAMQAILLNEGFDDFGAALVLPDDLVERCLSVSESQQPQHAVEVVVGEKYFSWHLFPMLTNNVSDDEHQRVVGYLFDITDLKQAQLVQAKEKSDARRDFIAKMVHELRTPLNAIIGFSQVLMRRNKEILSERDFNSLKAIRVAGLQLNDMVSDTLDISKIEAGKMELAIETFTVARLLSSFEDQVITLAEAKGLEYRIECDAYLQVISDSKKVRQILINLISNAIKYTHKGCVSVAITPTAGDQVVCGIEIIVRDSGVGIPSDQIDNLFDSYSQVSEQQNRNIQGTGLGLALVAELVELLSGSIRVTSEHHVGSCFTVILPNLQPA